MLPFLKNKDDASMGSEDEPTKKRKPDNEEEFGMLDAIAEDLLSAFEKKDKGMLKSALEALCEYVREEDEEQDLGM